MQIKIVKKGNVNAKPQQFCNMFVDEAPLNKR
jgi:hypothetical protein